jgi:lipoprotein-anchoring transpeptidase ErfK/SrfK
MRRTSALFILVVLVGVGGYFWYRGDARMWLRSVKDYLAPKASEGTGGSKGAGREPAKPVHAVAVLPYRDAIVGLRASTVKERLKAWDTVSRAFTRNEEGAREAVQTGLHAFVEKYVLSGRLPDDERIAARVDVKKGDRLGDIAKHHRTTVEAIKRLNGLTSDLIRPGLTLKVLNQPVAVYVDKSDFLLWVTYGGRVLLAVPCGLGKENRTVPGTYEVAERLVDPEWYPPTTGEVIPPGDPRNELGCRWIGFKDSGLGIHEARNDGDVGKESSNGCIRLLQKDVELLFDIVPLGTTVTIME